MSEGSGTLAPSTDNSTVSDLVHKGVIPTNHSGAVFIIESTTSLFSKAIIMMSRVGDNLYLVPTAEGLYLKAYNSSKTVCGGFLFRNEFFLYRDTTRLNVDRAQNVCRISMKCAISTFHQIGEKKPCNSLVLFLDPMGTHIKFIFYVNCDVVRTHEIGLREANTTFRTLFDEHEKKQMPNVVKGLPNIFLKAMGSANAYFDTIIDCNMNDRMYFKRFLPPDDVQAKVMKREAYIPVNDLEKYKIRVKAEISIGTKEFMAILLYAEANNVSVMDILFGEPGQPLIIVISETPEDFSAEFQISTVEGECSNYTRTENLSNASFSVSQLDMSNHRPDQRIQAKKRKTPVVVTEPVTRMPRLSFDPQRPSTSAAASEAAHNDSFNDDDDEELLSVVTEMSIRHNQLTQATQQRTQQSVIVIEDEEDEDVQPIKRHSPGANRTHRVESSHELDDPINDSAIQAISLPQNHDPVPLLDNPTPKFESITFNDYRTPPPEDVEEEVEDMFQGSPEQEIAEDYLPPCSQGPVQLDEDMRDETPPPEDEEEADMFPASPEPIPPMWRGSQRVPVQNGVEEDGRDETPPPEEMEEDDIFPASPEPINRAHLLNASQATLYGTQVQGRVLASETQRRTQIDPRRKN